MDSYIDIKKRDAALTTAANASKQTSYWRFAATRHPYDRLVSCYSEKVCKQTEHELFENGLSKIFKRFPGLYGFMPFDEFVDVICDIPDYEADQHLRSQHTFITDKHDNLIVDYLCDFNELPGLVKEIQKRTGQPVELPHLLKSSHSEFELYYTAALKTKVAKRYQRDFELLGYTPD